MCNFHARSWQWIQRWYKIVICNMLSSMFGEECFLQMHFWMGGCLVFFEHHFNGSIQHMLLCEACPWVHRGHFLWFDLCCLHCRGNQTQHQEFPGNTLGWQPILQAGFCRILHYSRHSKLTFGMYALATKLALLENSTLGTPLFCVEQEIDTKLGQFLPVLWLECQGVLFEIEQIYGGQLWTWWKMFSKQRRTVSTFMWQSWELQRLCKVRSSFSWLTPCRLSSWCQWVPSVCFCFERRVSSEMSVWWRFLLGWPVEPQIDPCYEPYLS